MKERKGFFTPEMDAKLKERVKPQVNATGGAEADDIK